MPLERKQLVAACRIPGPGGFVHSRRCQLLSIGTENYAIDTARVSLERFSDLTTGRVPENDLAATPPTFFPPPPRDAFENVPAPPLPPETSWVPAGLNATLV